MKQTTLCFLLKDDKILLAMKKRGFGVGKWNGVGGKLKENEMLLDSAAREIKEEIGVDVALKNLKSAGTLKFRFEGKPEWEQVCNVFVVRQWIGESNESEEMRPQWFPINELPFDSMWVDDRHWLPKVIAGQVVEGGFLFTADGERMLECRVNIKQES